MKTSLVKARLVSRGFTQKTGEDFKETFAPVANGATFRTVLAIAAGKEMKVKHKCYMKTTRDALHCLRTNV